MNDDPTAASNLARLPTGPLDDDDDHNRDHGNSDAESQAEGDAGGGSGRPPDALRSRRSRKGLRRRSSSRVRRAKAGIAKKLDFMTQFMCNVDVAVFVELCILYYMDCSFFRLAIRAVTQYLYLTPKSEDFTRIMAPPKPQIPWVIGSNIFCMLLHIWFAPPEAGETMRGYLHGGVIIDFVGQKAPTSRINLLLLDCLVLVLQCVMCAVWLELDQLKKMESVLKGVSTSGILKITNATTSTAPPDAMGVATGGISLSTQDLDAEERGVMRDYPLGVNETNDIEMQPLVRQPFSVVDENTDRILEARFLRIVRTAGGSDSTEGPGGRPTLLDILMSGNGLLANLYVPNAARILWERSVNEPDVPGYPLRFTGYSSRIAQLAARSQLRIPQARQQRA